MAGEIGDDDFNDRYRRHGFTSFGSPPTLRSALDKHLEDLPVAREDNLVPVGEVRDDGKGGGGDGVPDS